MTYITDKKQKIIKLLKKESLSTSKIASSLNSNYWTVMDILNEMEKENLIKKNITVRGMYWELNENQNND